MQPASTVRWMRARRAVAAALAAAFAILLPASITSAWIRGTILSTSGYLAAVTPVAASQAVRSAVKDAVTSQVDAAIGKAGTVLPQPDRVLAGLLGARLSILAGNGVGQLMASQAFQHWWADANRLAHSQLISILNGDSTLVTTTGGQVALNLPARRQIPLFPAAALARPRHVYRVLVGVLSLILILTVLTFAGALAASPRRRRTLLQMTIGGTLTSLAVMAAASWGQSSLIDRAAPPYRAVTSVIVHAVTAGFFTMTTWCAAGGIAITAIALMAGGTPGEPRYQLCRWKQRRRYSPP
jgi:hypothetical protein